MRCFFSFLSAVTKKQVRSFIVILLSVSLVNVFPASNISAETLSPESSQTETPSCVDGEVLVTTSHSARTSLVNSLEDDMTIEQSWNFDDIHIAEVSSDERTTDELIEELENDPSVIAVEPNYIQKKLSTKDSYRSFQWYLNKSDAFSGTSPGIRENEIPADLDSSEPIVAVVDTGVDYTHEDLYEHMWVNPYPSLRGRFGFDFGSDDSDPMDEDKDGHGTHCAGTISAIRDNNIGIAGISGAKIMALKIFDSEGNAKNSSIIGAFQYIFDAQKLGANIVAVNCSWGGAPTPEAAKTLIHSIGEKGALFLFAAGNDTVNQDTNREKECPYDIDSHYIVTVGASDKNDNSCAFSDYGKNSVDLFAPGDQILSAINEEEFLPFIYSKEQRDTLCSFYSSLDSDVSFLYTPTEIGIRGNNITYGQKSFSKEDFWGAENSGSLCVPISAGHNTAVFEIYADVSQLSMDQNSSYYVSFDIGAEENGMVKWEHVVTTRNKKHFVRSNGRTYLKLPALSNKFDDFSCLYIDNPGISAPLDKNLSYGKYSFQDGTSSAAPIVSAAAALLASLYPDDNAWQRKSRLLHCVRPVDSLSDKCRQGGVLDLSKLTTAVYDSKNPPALATPTSTPTNPPQKVLVTKVKLNKKKLTLRYGRTFKLKATVSPTNASNKKVKWTVSNKKYASVSQKGKVTVKKRGIGHKVKVYAKATDGSGKKAVCTVKIVRKK